MRHEEHRLLTSEYAENVFKQQSIVQINLDNCSIQRMEQLPLNPSLEDVERVGLMPLVDLLQKAPVALSAAGINEMPDKWVSNARAAYQKFCAKFWPGHFNDTEATNRDVDEASTAKIVEFMELDEGKRCTYGAAYVSLLQIQNIRRTYSLLNPEQQFEIYIHSMISMLNMVSAFELEIAKHAFWGINANEINKLPSTVQSRLSDIKKNFSKQQSTLQKCKEFAFNGAMDIHWLSGSNLSEDLDLKIKIGSTEYLVDNWVGTNDVKLYRISKDIHSVFAYGSTMKRLAVTREHVLDEYQYWQYVDRLAKDVLGYRARENNTSLEDLLQRIDMSIVQVEESLSRFF
jgi:hypothetical protein